MEIIDGDNTFIISVTTDNFKAARCRTHFSDDFTDEVADSDDLSSTKSLILTKSLSLTI